MQICLLMRDKVCISLSHFIFFFRWGSSQNYYNCFSLSSSVISSLIFLFLSNIPFPDIRHHLSERHLHFPSTLLPSARSPHRPLRRTNSPESYFRFPFLITTSFSRSSFPSGGVWARGEGSGRPGRSPLCTPVQYSQGRETPSINVPPT